MSKKYKFIIGIFLFLFVPHPWEICFDSCESMGLFFPIIIPILLSGLLILPTQMSLFIIGTKIALIAIFLKIIENRRFNKFKLAVACIGFALFFTGISTLIYFRFTETGRVEYLYERLSLMDTESEVTNFFKKRGIAPNVLPDYNMSVMDMENEYTVCVKNCLSYDLSYEKIVVCFYKGKVIHISQEGYGEYMGNDFSNKILHQCNGNFSETCILGPNEKSCNPSALNTNKKEVEPFYYKM